MLSCLSKQLASTMNRRFDLKKTPQTLFIYLLQFSPAKKGTAGRDCLGEDILQPVEKHWGFYSGTKMVALGGEGTLRNVETEEK